MNRNICPTNKWTGSWRTYVTIFLAVTNFDTNIPHSEVIWTTIIIHRFKERDKVGWWIIVKDYKTKLTRRRLFRTWNWVLNTKWSYTDRITNFQQGSWNILKIIEDSFCPGKNGNKYVQPVTASIFLITSL